MAIAESISNTVSKHSLPIGAPAPNLFIDTGCGTEATALSQLKGRVVVLAFSRPGWDPARQELIDDYNRALGRVSGLDAKLLEINDRGHGCKIAQLGEDESTVELALMSGIDSYGAVAKAYGVYGRNALFIVDEFGNIAWSYTAPIGTSPNADELLSALSFLSPKQCKKSPLQAQLTRRQFVAAAVATAFALSIPVATNEVHAQGEGTYAPLAQSETLKANQISISLDINGSQYPLQIDPRTTLLDALREQIGLTGTKKGCDHGQCGACTVHLDDRRVNSCLLLAAMCRDKKIVTIEGLAVDGTLHKMQTSFIAHDGFQCGYCTPGQIMSAVALLDEPCGPDDSDVRELMSGNICRCGAYPNIIDAIQDVRGNRTSVQARSETEGLGS